MGWGRGRLDMYIYIYKGMLTDMYHYMNMLTCLVELGEGGVENATRNLQLHIT